MFEVREVLFDGQEVSELQTASQGIAGSILDSPRFQVLPH